MAAAARCPTNRCQPAAPPRPCSRSAHLPSHYPPSLLLQVGHNALGAGQLIDQGASLVDNALRTGSLFAGQGWAYIEPSFAAHTLHFIGLLSDGGVHSRTDQLYAMVKGAAERGAKKIRWGCGGVGGVVWGGSGCGFRCGDSIAYAYPPSTCPPPPCPLAQTTVLAPTSLPTTPPCLCPRLLHVSASSACCLLPLPPPCTHTGCIS